MARIAFVFSGQGAQYPGMGRDFYDHSTGVRALYDAAEEYRPGTKAQSFSGTPEELKRTETTQPCLFLAGLAAATALTEAGIVPDAAAGFSLGELPALAFSGALGPSPMTGFALTVKRGRIMGAADTANTAMAAVLKLENKAVEDLCARYPHLTPVNYNAPGQLVISGDREELEAASKEIKALGGRAVPLAVSGAFHSPYMDAAAAAFAEELKAVSFSAPRIPVYANVTAQPYGADVTGVLSRQMNHPVLWEQTVRNMVSDGIEVFLECGAGTTLLKLIGKIAPEVTVYKAETTEDIAKIKEELR